MKKKYILAICAAMACTMLAGCGESAENDNETVQFTAEMKSTETAETEALQTSVVTTAAVSEKTSESSSEVTTSVTTTVTTVTEAVTSETTAQTEESKETEKAPEETEAPEEGSKSEETGNSEQTPSGFSESDLTFTYNGSSVTLGKELSDFIAACEPNESNSGQSCRGNGVDWMYNYSDFTIVGYDDGDGIIAVSIDFTSEEVETDKKIKIGSSADDLIKAYGDSYTERGSFYVYRAGKGTLEFKISNDSVSVISYNYEI